MQFFKFLNADGVSEHGDGATWVLPHDGMPGEWMPRASMEIIPVPPEILDYYSPWDRKPVWYRGVSRRKETTVAFGRRCIPARGGALPAE